MWVLCDTVTAHRMGPAECKCLLALSGFRRDSHMGNEASPLRCTLQLASAVYTAPVCDCWLRAYGFLRFGRKFRQWNVEVMVVAQRESLEPLMWYFVGIAVCCFDPVVTLGQSR